MPIFKSKNNTLSPIKETRIKLEKDLQKVVEDNLETIFGLDFVASEFALNNLRIDTLAFDKETNSFVIIEYKRDKSFSVIDQGYAYLALMLNNKADFILEYNEEKNDNLKRSSIDWSQSRVLFLANAFTAYQQNAINFKDLPIELWEVKKYDNQTMLFHQLKATDSKESIKTVSKSETVESVSREVRKYSIDDHFKEDWTEGRGFFDSLIEQIKSKLGEINIHPVKHYIGIRLSSNSNFIALKSRKSSLVVELLRVEPKDLDDPQERLKYRNRSFEFWGKHITIFKIKTEDDVDYAMFLIKQVYNKFYQ
jgi:predicted transport protein